MNRVVATQVNGHTFTVSDRYDFSNSKILGRGTYGVVATALDTVANRTIAIKRIRPFANDDWDARHTLREIRLLRVLGPHPNIISLYNLSAYEEKAELYMMMELMDCDLHRVIQSKQVLTPKHIKCFLKQILEGIRAMHEVGVFHRDLKPGNILVSKDCQVRITDFGLARFMDEATRQGTNKLNPMTEYVVTRWYRAPELLLAPGGTYNEEIDLWSIGCIFAELLRRKPLFPGKSHAHQVQLIFELLGYDPENLGFVVTAEAARYLDKRSVSFHSNATTIRQAVGGEASDEAIDLIEQLLTINPACRCSAAIALQSDFLKGADLLSDYSRNYIKRPSLEDFDFEQEKYSLEELKAMIVEGEIGYYRRQSLGGTVSSPAGDSGAGWSVLEGDENYVPRAPSLPPAVQNLREGAHSRDSGRGDASNGSYMDDGPTSQLPTNTASRPFGSGVKRTVESMLEGGSKDGNSSLSSTSRPSYRQAGGTAVGNIIASARSMNASSPTPRQTATPTKSSVTATLHKESKARQGRTQPSAGSLAAALAAAVQNNGQLAPLIDAGGRLPLGRVPPLPFNAKSELPPQVGSVFTNLQTYQTLSARGPALAPAAEDGRKVFTAPSFHFPPTFGQNGSAGGSVASSGAPTPSYTLGAASHAWASQEDVRSSLDSSARALGKAASWKQPAPNRLLKR